MRSMRKRATLVCTMLGTKHGFAQSMDGTAQSMLHTLYGHKTGSMQCTKTVRIPDVYSPRTLLGQPWSSLLESVAVAS